jgi:hypothetical protein
MADVLSPTRKLDISKHFGAYFQDRYPETRFSSETILDLRIIANARFQPPRGNVHLGFSSIGGERHRNSAQMME